MNIVTDIFAEYVNKRQNGLTRDEALDILRNYIRELPKPEREELTGYIRTWEAKRIASNDVDLPPVSRTSTTPISQYVDNEGRKQAGEFEQIKGKDTAFLPQIQATSHNKVKCTNCSKFNDSGAVICYACGFMLDAAAERFGTRPLKEIEDHQVEHQKFGKMSSLILKIRDTKHEFEVRPQLFAYEIIVGRSTKNSTIVPDVDLADYNGNRLGVSRLHLAIKYEHRNDTVQVYDLKSSNGTTLNGELLPAHEGHTLQDGDQLCLGHLILDVTFQQKST